MSHIPRLTAIGLYNYDETLFDGLNLPEGINKEDLIDNFLLEYGECPLLYTDLDFVKFAIRVFSKKWYSNIEKIISAMTDNYNPLHNFDRHEIYTDVEGKTGTLEAEGDSHNTMENTVSAFNSSTYQPDNKTVSDGNTSESSSSKEDRELTHEGHLYGNIGVTTSQAMLTAELELREKQNVLHIVSELLYKEICVYTY